MYQDIKEVYWCNDMKRNVADFVARCPNYQQVKAELQRPGGLAQNIEILMWKWEMINMGFVVVILHTCCKFNSISVIEDRHNRTICSAVYQENSQTDEQVEHTILMHEDILRACVIDFKGSWDNHLPLIEFTYNNSYHASIHMASFEALYCWRCRSPIGWFEIGEAELIGLDLVHQAIEKVKIIKE
ncbi:uncharacterized protein [Nicotiana tomentosiformis]|uniref:uncharacterized protein n=1 Tax=Nicotiana tomentosiformis TaxID=4098 RepID=UPI00388C916A